MKSSFYAILLIFLIISVIGCSKSSGDSNLPACEFLSTDYGLDQSCKSYLAKEKKDISFCKSYFTVPCYSIVALATKNIRYCEKESPWQNDLCFRKFAIIESNASHCEKIKETHLRDPCFGFLAMQQRNIDFCNSIEDSGWKDGCIKSIGSGEGIICENFADETSKDECYNLLAEINQDAASCGKIKRPILKDDCYYHLAVSLNEPSFCDSISSHAISGSCYYSQAGVQIGILKDEEYCEKLGEMSDSCYYFLAIIKEDQSFCDKIKFDSSDPYSIGRSTCKKRVSLSYNDLEINIKKGNLKFCEKSNEPDYCFRDIARNLRDEKLCEKIRDQQQKNFCYYYLAEDKQDFNICNQIVELESNNKWSNTSVTSCQDNIYSELAKRSTDITTCNNIRNGEKQATCFFEIAVNSKNEALCDNLINKDSKKYCNEAVRERIRSQIVCSQIREDFQYEKARCYQHMRDWEGDRTACGGITDVKYREYCYDGVYV